MRRLRNAKASTEGVAQSHRCDAVERARRLSEWFQVILVEKAGRDSDAIIHASRQVLQYHRGKPGVPDDLLELLCLHEVFADSVEYWLEKPEGLQRDFSASPPWDCTELQLVAGWMLSKCAMQCFESKSVSQVLVGAPFLVDAAAVRDTWIHCRGSGKCRFPDERWVKVDVPAPGIPSASRSHLPIWIKVRAACDATMRRVDPRMPQ